MKVLRFESLSFVLGMIIVGCGGGAVKEPSQKPQEENTPPLSGLYEFIGFSCLEDGFTLEGGIYANLNDVIDQDYQVGRIYSFDFNADGKSLRMIDPIVTAIERSSSGDCKIEHHVEISFDSETSFKILGRNETFATEGCGAQTVEDSKTDFESEKVGKLITFRKQQALVFLQYFSAAENCVSGGNTSTQGALKLKKNP